MNLQLDENEEVWHYQNLEKSIFELDNFSPERAVFPKKLFKIKFDNYFFIKTADWFHSEEDYFRLILFVKYCKSDFFFASCPPFYMINAIKVGITNTFSEYVDNHTFTNIKHLFSGVGIRKSPETFYYDESKKWAIVCDITNNITIIGLKNELFPAFEKAFDGYFENIEKFLENHSFSEDLLQEFRENYL